MGNKQKKSDDTLSLLTYSFVMPNGGTKEEWGRGMIGYVVMFFACILAREPSECDGFIFD